MNFFNNKKDAAAFVGDLKKSFPNGSPLTMTIPPEKYVVCSVSTAIGKLSDEIEQLQVASFFSQTQVNT